MQLVSRDWSFLPGRHNRRRRRRRRNLQRRIINYSDEGEVIVKPEVNKRATGFRWKKKPTRTLKFVDDGMSVTKINMQTADDVGMVGGKTVREKHDLMSKNVLGGL